MEIKICTKCGGGFSTTSEFFSLNKGSKDGLRGCCKECKRLDMKQYVQTKDCKTTFQRWQKANPKFHIECFYAIREAVKRHYKNILQRIGNPEHFEYEKNTRCLFESFDEFLSYLIFNLGFNDLEKFRNLKVYRVDPNRDYGPENIQLIEEYEYYVRLKITMSLPPVKTCPRCFKKFYQFRQSVYCEFCARKLDKERGQSPKKKTTRDPIKKHLQNLFECVKPINPNFLFRLPDRLILLKLSYDEFIEYCNLILANRDPRKLRLDLIDYDKNIEKDNLEFLTPEEFRVRHKGAN